MYVRIILLIAIYFLNCQRYICFVCWVEETVGWFSGIIPSIYMLWDFGVPPLLNENSRECSKCKIVLLGFVLAPESLKVFINHCQLQWWPIPVLIQYLSLHHSPLTHLTGVVSISSMAVFAEILLSYWVSETLSDTQILLSVRDSVVAMSFHVSEHKNKLLILLTQSGYHYCYNYSCWIYRYIHFLGKSSYLLLEPQSSINIIMNTFAWQPFSGTFRLDHIAS